MKYNIEFQKRKLPNKLAYLTYHNYSQFIIYPYSSSYSYEADNKDELANLAGVMVSEIRKVHGKGYSYGEGSDSRKIKIIP